MKGAQQCIESNGADQTSQSESMGADRKEGVGFYSIVVVGAKVVEISRITRTPAETPFS